ncbi:MAG TPA: hypothetical protein VNJ71_07995 [Gemmatimonadales bacterium]|jgi:hypothetical protein|nr:hypothetical protein [Gemmatimonadales bacterium]
MRQSILLLLGLVALGDPRPLAAQARGFGMLLGGLATDADNSSSGSDVAFALGGGLQVGLIGFGLEVGEQHTGGDHKSDLLGGFFRVAAPVGRFRPFVVGGLGVYRFAPSGVFDRTRGGASLGGGLLVDLGIRRIRFALEGRYHSVFDKEPGLSAQRFVTVLGGVQVGL